MKNIIVIACCRSGHNFVMNQIRSWDMGHAIIHNFEDLKPLKYEARIKYWTKAGVIDNYFDTNTIIVVRDLLNWWASYMTWIFDKPVPEENIQNAFDIWVAQVKEAFGETEYIDHYHIVNYDIFKWNRSTRKGLCSIIGGEYSEVVIDYVPEAGGGSSFDKGIPGQAMETGLRYKQALAGSHGGYYTHILSQNKEAIQLYKTHFSLTAEQKAICKLIN